MPLSFTQGLVVGALILALILGLVALAEWAARPLKAALYKHLTDRIKETNTCDTYGASNPSSPSGPRPLP